MSSTSANVWEKVIDEASGDPYWWNVETGETTWDDPTTATASSAEEEKEGNNHEEEGKDDENSKNQPEIPKVILPAKVLAEQQQKSSSASASANPTESSATGEDSADSSTENSNNNHTSNEAQPATDPSADYYNSKEYYEWYYAQMSAAAAASAASGGNLPGTISIPVNPAATTYSQYQYQSAWSGHTAVAAQEADIDLTNSTEFAPVTDGLMSGTFNAKTGRFQTQSYFDPISKAERQMFHFFDIEAYQIDRNREKMMEMMHGGKKKVKLTKKELEKIKQKNKEKKFRSLCKRLGDD